MRHEVVRTFDAWSMLKGEWNTLLAKSPTASLFMTWEWLDTWLRVHERCTDLLVVCVRSADGELLGLAPYYRSDYRLLSVLPYRVLRMIGDSESGAEYQAWIFDRADEARICAEIMRVLRELCPDWDMIWMPNLDAWSAANRPMLEAFRADGLTVRRRQCLFSTVPLPKEFDSYLTLMSANRRQQIRRMARKILQKPGVEVREITSRDCGFALEALFRLHNKRWRSVGQDGVFLRNPLEKEFYEQFAPKALDQGWLAMYALLDDGEPKAVQIGYVYGNVLLQLQEGFDIDYSPHVGNALRAFVIEECIRNGIEEYDFLGGVSEHKRRWLAEERIGMDLLVFDSRLKNLPLRVGIWPTGRYLRPK